jgi:hypothetical protein
MQDPSALAPLVTITLVQASALFAVMLHISTAKLERRIFLSFISGFVQYYYFTTFVVMGTSPVTIYKYNETGDI